MLMRISSKTIKFLGVSRQVPLGDLLGFRFHMLEEYLRDGTIERLQKAANSEQVYGMVYCEGEDPEHMTYSYKVACEDKSESKTTNEEFESITLDPCHYCVFQDKGNSPQEHEAEVLDVMNQAYRDYLPGSDFVPLVDLEKQTGKKGLAIIHKFMPLDLLSSSYDVQVWVPIQEKKIDVQLTEPTHENE